MTKHGKIVIWSKPGLNSNPILKTLELTDIFRDGSIPIPSYSCMVKAFKSMPKIPAIS